MTATTCSARASSAPRAPPSASSTPTPTGCAPRWSAGTASCARPPGTRPYAVAAGTPRRGHRSTAARRRRRPRQPERPHHGRRPLPAAALRALGTRSSSPPARSTRCPSTSPAAALRQRGRHPRARPRPHRPSAAPRRQPAGVQRQSVHRPRLPGQAQGAAQARRHAHRHRPPPHPHRRLADRHIAIRPGTDALLLAPSPRSSSRRASSTSGRSPPTSRASRNVRALAEEFTPEAVAAACDVRRRGHPHARPRTRRRPDRRRLRPHRQLHRRVRHPRQLARRRPQHPHRQPRPARRRPLPARPPTTPAPRPPAGPRVRARAAGTAGSAATPRPRASCRSPRSPRRSTRPAKARSAR